MGAWTSKSSSSTKNPPPEITSTDRAILDLKNSRDRLRRYREKLSKDEVKLIQGAIKARDKGQTQTALNLIKLRKYKQQQVTDCENQLLNVMKLVDTIDSKQNEVAVIEALKVGKDTLQRMHQETTVDDVLNLMDDIREEHEIEQEITNVINNSVPTLSSDDELAIEQELAALVADDLPTAPTTELPTTTTPELPIAPTETPRPPISTETAGSSGRVAVPAS